MSVKDNLKYINLSISDSAKRANRNSTKIQLLAVSKTKPLELLLEAYDAGQRLFGENRVNEAEIKVPQLPSDAQFHMIGHLQSNKVKKACTYFTCIQSVDSMKIAKKIDNTCRDMNKIMDIYLDINIVNDHNKSGFIVNDDFFTTFETILNMENIRIIGLMCIGAHVQDKTVIRSSFRGLKDLSNLLKTKFPEFHGDKLSMGMSGDYEQAIEEGSTMVRVGSRIFGLRD